MLHPIYASAINASYASVYSLDGLNIRFLVYSLDGLNIRFLAYSLDGLNIRFLAYSLDGLNIRFLVFLLILLCSGWWSWRLIFEN